MKNFLPMIALAAILMTPLMSAYGTGTGSSSSPIQGSVTINAITCGISANPNNGASGISYGSINPGATTMADSPIIIQNNGNTPTTSVTVMAGDWIDSSANAVAHITAQNTAFTLDPNRVDPTTGLPAVLWTPLSPTFSDPTQPGFIQPGTTLVTNTIAGGSSQNTYWQLTANLGNDPFSGQLTQTMTFISGC